MARSWEYSRARHIAMQITMWIILALTLGVAALVARDRRQSVQVALSDPAALGPLMVRWPAGWSHALSQDGDRIALTAIEPRDARGRGGRVFQITEQFIPGNPPAPLDYLAANLLTADFHPRQIFLEGLQQLGVQTQLPPEELEDTGPTQGMQPGLYASAVAPLSIGRSLGMIASLEEMPRVTPADEDLFRQLLNAVEPLHGATGPPVQ